MTDKNLPRRKTRAEDIPVVQVFRTNVRALLDAAQAGGHPITQLGLAKLAGIAPRTFTHQLSLDANSQSAPTLRTLQAVAKAFGIEPWQLLVEDFPAEVALSPQIQRTVRETITRYLGAAPESRSAVDETAKLLPQRKVKTS